MRFNAASVTPRCRVRAYVVLSGAPHNFEPHRTETMMTGKLSPEGEVIATYGATVNRRGVPTPIGTLSY